jgi:cytochrome c biogenesis protein CcdA
MDPFITGMGMAVWFGILTSISPCPLATNIAAISFIGKQLDNASVTLLSGLFYTLGRVVTYLVLGVILVSSAEAIPAVSFFLQQKMKLVMGPLLVGIALVLLDVLPVSFSGARLSHESQTRLARSGIWGAFLLGIVFALSFCPVSAALFFGSTFGLAAQHGSRILIPSLYGIGTAAPVVACSFVIAFGAHAAGTFFHNLTLVERWARKITAILFLGAGAYFILRVNLGIFS